MKFELMASLSLPSSQEPTFEPLVKFIQVLIQAADGLNSRLSQPVPNFATLDAFKSEHGLIHANFRIFQ